MANRAYIAAWRERRRTAGLAYYYGPKDKAPRGRLNGDREAAS